MLIRIRALSTMSTSIALELDNSSSPELLEPEDWPSSEVDRPNVLDVYSFSK